MSEQIKHECGIALIRLLKPLEFYYEKYGTPFYALSKLYLLMEKQHNRGHDGVGVACIKLETEPGCKYISLEKSIDFDPIRSVFSTINQELSTALQNAPDHASTPAWLKENTRFSGELFLGHLRYGTYGTNSIETCHPHLRENNWMSRSLLLAGNFNLTNVDELFSLLIDIGQHPKDRSDTVTILEKIGHFLDEANTKLVREYKTKGFTKKQISEIIMEKLDILDVLKDACKKWDGGYVVAGLIGHGDAFVVRDPAGIRPAFYYADDEVIAVTSERPAIQTAFNVQLESIKQITPGHALIIRKNGDLREAPFINATEKNPCSFERIYFSRGTDADIYLERKALGKYVTNDVLQAVDYDLKNTVFSFIPNTAESCFYGMIEELNHHCDKTKKAEILELGNNITDSQLDEILSFRPRAEKVAVKDVKLRTFITDASQRNELVAHVYDITYGTLKRDKDTLVVIDDSIVRGTTLRESILKILDRLGPKKIVLVSSAPQIRYPDCYGIDMANIGNFVAFKAAIELLKQYKKTDIIDSVYKRCKAQQEKPAAKVENYVKEIYRPFTAEEISLKITELLKPNDINAEVEMVFQKIENLHLACPNHQGDWYFTGDYPTPGGNVVVNRAFLNYVEGINERAY